MNLKHKIIYKTTKKTIKIEMLRNNGTAAGQEEKSNSVQEKNKKNSRNQVQSAINTRVRKYSNENRKLKNVKKQINKKKYLRKKYREN